MKNEKIRSVIAELGLIDRVRLAGRIPNSELEQWLVASEVWISASRSDTLPLSMLEAMACELKLVVAHLDHLQPWMDPSSCWTFEPGDIDDCSGKLAAALAAPAPFPHPGRQRVLACATIAHTLDALERLFAELT